MKKQMVGIILASALTASCLHGAERVWSGSGKASDGANWVGGAEPQAGDDVVFDGTSTADCEWDLELELGSWTQAIAYSGKVTVPKSDGMLFKVTGDIEVHGGDLVFAGDTTAIGDGTTELPFGVGYTLEAANIVIGTNASINADGQGFAKQKGPGAGYDTSQGAGYGGFGRNHTSLYGQPYGNARRPTALGSGGGHTTGGAGGGAIKIVANIITVDGELSANGANGSNKTQGIGGSGGSIWLDGGTLQGSGVIAANSGFTAQQGIRGSGGGRIDISDVTNNFSGEVQVFGQDISQTVTTLTQGMAGSILLPDEGGSGLNLAILVVTNSLFLGNSQTFGKVIVTNGGALYLDANEGNDIFCFDTMEIHAGAKVIVMGDVERLNLLADDAGRGPYGVGAILRGRRLRIFAGGSLNADGQGFGTQVGPGVGALGDYGRGSGFGGQGGDGQTVGLRSGGLPYGTNIFTRALGSGGSAVSYSLPGGGSVWLLIDETIRIDGEVSASSRKTSKQKAAGGSGGSIVMAAATVSGNGVVKANGGDVLAAATAGGGGGGKITVLYGETAWKRDKVLAGRLDLVRVVEGVTGFDGEVTAAAGVGYTGGEQQAEDGVVVFLQVIPAGGTVLMVR